MHTFFESSLNDSVVFGALNKQSQMAVLINDAIKNGIILGSSYIEEQILRIQKTRISPLADNVLNAYEKGEIVLVYSKHVKIPQALPFIILKSQGSLKAFIFVNNYGSLIDNEKAGGGQYLNIPMKDLYVLMEGAYTALQYHIYPIQITKNLGLMKLSANIYTSMILRILNKEYALSMDKDIYNQVAFCISRFFLDNIWESKNFDINTAYSITNIIGANKSELNLLSETYNEANINSISDLISFLKTISRRLDKLNIRYFTDRYISTYKSSALFSMECLTYFLYTIEAGLIGSFIVNQPIITDITKNIKGMNTFYPELSKSI